MPDLNPGYPGEPATDQEYRDELVRRALLLFSRNATPQKVDLAIQDYSAEAVEYALDKAEENNEPLSSWGWVLGFLGKNKREGSLRHRREDPPPPPAQAISRAAEPAAPITPEEFIRSIELAREPGLVGRMNRTAILRAYAAGEIAEDMAAMIPPDWLTSGLDKYPAAGSTLGRVPRGRLESIPE